MKKVKHLEYVNMSVNNSLKQFKGPGVQYTSTVSSSQSMFQSAVLTRNNIGNLSDDEDDDDNDGENEDG